jgi:hypothetical protein
MLSVLMLTDVMLNISVPYLTATEYRVQQLEGNVYVIRSDHSKLNMISDRRLSNCSGSVG